jgi:hypothetical protein
MADDSIVAALEQSAYIAQTQEDMLPAVMQEFGTTGLRRAGGQIAEDLLVELRGINGVRRFPDMYDNDPIAGGMIFAITKILGRLPWEITADEGTDPNIVAFVQSCFEDMDTPWSEILEDALSLCTYGWALMEMNLKIRGGENAPYAWQISKFSDGKLGWRSFAIRSQDTLVQWNYSPEGKLLSMTQLDPDGGGIHTIPIKKALLFRTTSFKNNPEGRSLLRAAYRPWFYKKRIEDFEGIGIERDLAGLPVAYLPPGYFSPQATVDQKATLRTMQTLVSDIRQDANGGVVMPIHFNEHGEKDVYLELLTSTSRKTFDTNAIIVRKSNEMAQSILMDFVMLGNTGVGSFSLGEAKIDLWTMAVEAIAKSISDTFNKNAIGSLLKWNNMTVSNPPKLTFGEVSNVDLNELGNFLKNAAAAGALVPDAELLKYVRQVAHIPEPQAVPGFDGAPVQ